MSQYKNFSNQMGRNLKREFSSVSGTKFVKHKLKDVKKKHAEAERWRRWRINGHLKTLSELLRPNMTSKNAKASILTETVRQVKALRKRAVESGLLQDKDGWFSGSNATSPSWTFPSECDEAKISSLGRNSAKATICCEDRPNLNRSLITTIHNSGAKPIRAELTTLGGRVLTEVVVQWPEGSGGDQEVGSLRRGLKALVDNQGLGCDGLGQLLGLERPGSNRVVISGSIDSNRGWGNLLIC